MRPQHSSGSSGKAAAEALAIEALSFLAAEPERIGRFLAVTGLGPQELRAMAHQRSFLTAVLDYLAADESLLVAFASDTNRNPADIAKARRALGGAEWERETA